MLSARNIQQRRILFDNYRLIPEAAFEHEHQRTQATPHDILLTIVGTIGRVAIVQEDTPEFTLQRSVAVLKPNTSLTPRFLAYALESPRIQKHLTDNAKGTAQKGIYLKALGNLEVEVAPLPEQKRIADKLDAVLARVDACRDRLDRIPAIIKRFRQSVLAAATSGKLTEEWRGEDGKFIKSWHSTIPDDGVPLPDNYNRLGKIAFKLTKIEHSAGELPSTWSLLTIADLYNTHALIDFADGNHGGMYPRKEEFTGEGALFLTATQIGENWEIDIHACPRLRNDKAQQLVKGWAKKNDVLLTHNATVGRVALLEYGEEDVLLGTSVTFYRFNEKFISPNFARILFSSPFFQDQLQIEMSQTTRNQVPITKQVSLNFICPPIEEQTEIVRRVEALFAYADRLEARYTAARAQVEKLTPATLAKAFRGELVPQDPNDEPASVLLQRIRAQGDNKAKARRSSMSPSSA